MGDKLTANWVHGATSIHRNQITTTESPTRRPLTTRNIIRTITPGSKDTTKNMIMWITIVVTVGIIMIIAAPITVRTLHNTLIPSRRTTIPTPRNTVTSNTATSTAMTNEPTSARMSVRTPRTLTDMVPKLKGPRTTEVASTSGPNIISLPLTLTKTSNSPTKPLRPTSKAIWLPRGPGFYQPTTPKKEWTNLTSLRARTAPPIAPVTTKRRPKARTVWLHSPISASTPVKTTFRISMNHLDTPIKPPSLSVSLRRRIMPRKAKTKNQTVTLANQPGPKNTTSQTTIWPRRITAQVNICLLQLLVQEECVDMIKRLHHFLPRRRTKKICSTGTQISNNRI